MSFGIEVFNGGGGVVFSAGAHYFELVGSVRFAGDTILHVNSSNWITLPIAVPVPTNEQMWAIPSSLEAPYVIDWNRSSIRLQPKLAYYSRDVDRRLPATVLYGYYA